MTLAQADVTRMGQQNGANQAADDDGESAEPERQRRQLGRGDRRNVGSLERVISIAGGGALAAFGLTRALGQRSLLGGLLALGGADMAVRGITGYCPVYKRLGINTAKQHRAPAATIGHKQGIKVERAVTIGRPPEELFAFWRDFANLPRFMDHLESVTVQDGGRSHWVAKAPAGRTVEWDAEIINEKPGELIAWKSVGDADVPNAGSVHFTPAPGGRGTEVKVVLEYQPPAGRLGATVAKLFGEEPDVQVREDLRRLKQQMEAGVVPTTKGQPTAI